MALHVPYVRLLSERDFLCRSRPCTKRLEVLIASLAQWLCTKQKEVLIVACFPLKWRAVAVTGHNIGALATMMLRRDAIVVREGP